MADPTNPPLISGDAAVPKQGQSGIKLSRLKRNHPRVSPFRLKILHALYRGGHHLLDDADVMQYVFGRIGDESDNVYQERTRRAFYENLFAMVINQISAGLAQDPVHIAQNLTGKPADDDAPQKFDLAAPDEEDDDDEDAAPPAPGQDPGDKGEDEDENEPDDEDDDTDEENDLEEKQQSAADKAQQVVQADVDPYWKKLMDCASVQDDDGSEARSFDQVMRDLCVEAMVCGWGWLQADLPAPATDDDGQPVARTSLGEQEQAGDLDAYVVTWPSDLVTDWEEEAGKLIWLRTYEVKMPAADPATPRWPDKGGIRQHVWTIWTATGWQKYEIDETYDQPLSQRYQDESIIPITDEGNHSFGRVPWLRLDLCTPGTYLHVGDLIESLCRAYMNRQNGENWQWTQTCFQQLYEFLAPEMGGIDAPVSEAQKDPDRARRRRRAPGVVHERGNDDRAEFIGPKMDGAEIGQKATQDLRDSILRMTAQMALAQDTSGAMLKRSADSKKQDSIPQEIVLGAIGKRVLTTAKQAIKLLAMGREENPDDAPNLEGYEHFDVNDASDLVQDTVLLSQVEIPSARFKIESFFRVASAHLGDNINPTVLAEIRAQLETAITQDSIVNPPKPPLPPGFGDDPNDPDGGGGDNPFDKKGQGSDDEGDGGSPPGESEDQGGDVAKKKPNPFLAKKGG